MQRVSSTSSKASGASTATCIYEFDNHVNLCFLAADSEIKVGRDALEAAIRNERACNPILRRLALATIEK